ncbi:nuclear transport factor 2 family protein [Pseudomonas extremaustralis]|jgi:ketosteroid isomerase-like protein|uniref:YybH family protein n=1 Tax=Pseudomonas extremaustralis TaxID=359110 RepID=UPI0021C60C8C|nr:nuclear transport factor 2 family protein [Pseudomonas extremaustralis]MDF3132220.1 nuclear transport factor 2 family protein [Pseudomonas extremaustralis]MDG2967263.1 nuclear transport factor 2 family protein [Pseudomonas extremaustralis]UUJ39698.1 nuclear transport factor 2 family protein [Pseudomonas extremaustralis]
MSAHEVLKAAADLVAAFARNDRAAYFGAFTADASFVFYTLPQPLLSRDAYQALWDSWRQDEGFEVLSCTSSNAVVSLQGDLAIFIHDVATELRMNGEQFFSQERETIVFRRQGSQVEQQGLWLACHEHLSAMPEGLPPH